MTSSSWNNYFAKNYSFGDRIVEESIENIALSANEAQGGVRKII